MYRIEKRFTLPIGHRLSKHKGRCFSLHGHNFTVLVGVKCNYLNENDMVIDFSDLSAIVNKVLDGLDHCTILNKTDVKIAEQLKKIGTNVILMGHDPTAEKLSERFYKSIQYELESYRHPLVKIDYVTVYENEKSKATYSEE